MNGIKEIRLMLGISQSELAEYLSIPRSTLAMAETSQRLLPASSLCKIADLQVKINVNRGRRIDVLSKAEIKLSDELPAVLMTNRQNRCHLKLAVLQGKLKAMSNQYDQLTLGLEAVQNVLAEKPADAEDYVFWKWQQQRGLTKLEEYSLLRQDQLRLKIKMLETEAQHYK
jgi:transcriptional regulator with XRE-family HTH domain